MREEGEIMEELNGLDGELKSFPSEAHWFCPKLSDDDCIDYDNPDEPEDDMSPEKKHELIQQARERHRVAYKYSLILGLAPEISGQLLEDYLTRLNTLLTTCDKCVHNWHMDRKVYLKELAEQFDDDTVTELSNRLNAIDFRRLDDGLKKGAQILASVEPSLRTQNLLAKNDAGALLALYESLCCVEYLKSEEKLSSCFNYVFEQVQVRKVLRIGDILPAMARFLFDKDPFRLRFATNAWQKMTSSLTAKTFEWVVHDALSEAIASVSQPSASYIDIQRFWEGFLELLEKLNEDLITHSIRGMEVQPDIYHLALQHLSCNSEEIVYLVIEGLMRLLKKSPKDFWAAFGTISPVTVAEQIFLSPAFEKLLEKSQKFENADLSPATSWTPDFIDSLPSVHQHDACRSLLYHLFERLQDERISENARLACCRAGLDALRATLDSFVKTDYKINPSTSLIVINDIMGLVNTYIGTIVGFADLTDGDHIRLELKRLGMVVIRDALALDCKALSAEFYALEAGTQIQRGRRNHSQSIWQAVLDIFRPGNIDLAKSILAATTALTGLDELRPKDKKNPKMPDDHVQFNADFRQLNDNASRILERLSDFDVSDIQQMYRTPLTARPLFAALVSADQGIYEAAVEVAKTITGHVGKQDAIEGLLEQAFSPLLNSLTYAVTRITKARTFSPIPYLIKIGREILEALCGNNGLLRSRTLTEGDQHAVMTWWTYQWRALDMVFSTTEAWVPRVSQSTAYMQEFCRDGMEYAEMLFDKYSTIASALRDSSPSGYDETTVKSNSSRASLKKVLQIVCHNVNGLTLMLRLRDAYLVSVITSLLGKLLRCLGEYDLEIDEFASKYIKDACKRENERNFRRTNLTNQQKAELQRALDEHQGVEIVETPPPTVTAKKQSTIDAWSKSADGKRHEPTMGSKGHIPASSIDKHRSTLDKMRALQVKPNQATELWKINRRKAIEDKKRRDAEAIAKAKALRDPSGIVRGEGSGLRDIGGVAGKDHAPVRSEIMVGSSDEDSDSEDDVDETNALVTKRKEASKKVSEYEESRRRALQMQQQGPVRKTKVQRSAKDLRARVEPNMDKLYLEILNWDIFHGGDDPPTVNDCRKIADKFLDLDLYKKTFGPLLISEVWRSLVTAKDENNFKSVEIKVLNRLSVDKFMEVSTNMPLVSNRDLKISERDIVLFSRSPDPLNNLQEPHCLARVDRTNRKKDVAEITYRVSREINPAFLQCLVPNGKIHVLKIADMTTTQREFAALSSLEYYDLCNEVLEATPSPIQKYSEEKVSLISTKYSLNRGQAHAILSANDNDGFTLIQGPPGSGKTKTIVAMVGALITPTLQQQGEQFRARPQVNGEDAKRTPIAPKKKLLICAPSNAAVDELVVRLKEGIQPLSGPRQKINVIRIGRSDAISASVKDVMLDELVRVKLEGDKSEKKGILSNREKLHQEAAKIKERLNVIRPQMDEARSKNDKSLELKLQREFDGLKRSQAHIGAKIDEDKESGNSVVRENEINRRRFQQEIIDGAHVLCATLSGSGHDMFRNLNVEFETVIIDEAAQCIELSALIPLKYGCSKCILVGDPEQLPPTVLSRSAQSFGYEQSLFVRMQHNHPEDVHLLDTQYRMHPEISRFPSQQFYNNRLIDGEGMGRLRAKPWHASSILGPYRFFDVKGVQTKEARGHSFINIPELNAAIRLYQRLKADYKSYDFTGKIGIITSYKAQLNELKARFSNTFGESIFDEIEFNTTDAFQGREREIIIFSCVRAKETGGIGFLGDIRRMNVGLTRAKSSLWVLGDSRSLQQGEFWNKLIEDSKSRDRYTGGDVMALLSKPSSRIKTVQPSTPYDSDNSSQSAQSNLVATNEFNRPPPKLKVEDSDVEMVDPSSASSSRQSSVGARGTMSVDIHLNGAKPRDTGAKPEPRGSLLGGSRTISSETNQHGKRTREPSIQEDDIPIKKIEPKESKATDLEAALREQKAAKAMASTSASAPTPAPRPAGPLGVMPPRRKAPADPFIQRKPPRRK